MKINLYLRTTVMTLLLSVFALSAYAAGQITVKGTVTDDSGEPLIGANVRVEGGGNGTVTNIDGQYTISVASDATLEFSYVGYNVHSEKVRGRSVIDVVLSTSAVQLDQVVVIGYGTQKKADLTGSVAVVDMEEARKQPATDIASMLQGQVSGVSVATSSQPGNIASVRIRGVGSFSSVGPLYVIDGMIVNDANNLNPNEIENMQVLKDASAAAIYGARGANGVILITTKKGKAGKPTLDVTANWSVQQMPKTIDMMTGPEFMFYNEQAYINSGDTWPASGIAPGTVLPNTNWQKAVYQNGLSQDYNAMYTQGSENVHTALAFGYVKQEGVVKGPEYERYTVRVNNDATYRALTVGENMTYQYTWSQNYIASPFWDALTTPSVIPVRDPNEPSGKGGYGYGSANFPTYISNPIGLQERYDNQSVNNRIIGNIYAELSLFKVLKYRFNIGLDAWWGRTKEFDKAYTLRMASGEQRYDNKLKDIRDSRSSLIIENTLTYSQTIARNNITAMVGYTMEDVNWHYLAAEGYNQQVDGLCQIDLVGTQNNMWGSRQERRMTSILGRVDYNYDGRYYAQVNFRSDGCSKFGPNKRRGNFPSMSVGWRPSEESFWEPLRGWFDNFKIRASWGKIGDMQALGNYSYLSSINHEGPYEGFNAIFGPNGSETLHPGATQTSRVNVDLGWETKTTTNIGFDFNLFNSRLYGSFDWYNSVSSDLLYNIKTSWATGTDYLWTNYGKMRNRGIEIQVAWRDRVKDFNYGVSANISTVRNKVIRLGESFYQDGICRTEEGRSISEFYTRRFGGIFQSMDEVYAHTTTLEDGTVKILQPNAQPGDVRYLDMNQDGTIDDNDREFVGSPLPKFEAALNFSADWKGIDFNMLWTSRYGNKIYNSVLVSCLQFKVDNIPADVRPWTWDNPSNEYPRMYSGATDNTQASDRFVEDGSFLRLKNLQIGYTLPQSLTRKFFVERLRVYVSAQNLCTITKYKGYDPDIVGGVFSQGVDGGHFPNARTYSAGLQVNF
ncbi:MAG: TonB-dependent receptor [Clostridium sp.]|nr:TonB-dependent receptor [Clostridium sp.]